MATALRGLYRRGNIFWFAWTANGRRYHRSLKTSDEDEAIAEALKIRRAPVMIDSEPWKHEVARFIEHKKARGTFRAQSALIRKQKLEAMADEIGVSHVRDLTTDLVQRWYDGLGTLSPSTKVGYLSYLSSFCSWLVDTRKLRENPCARVHRDDVSSAGRKNFLEPEQVDALLAAVPHRQAGRDAVTNSELHYILLAGFDAGLRTEEIVESRPDWFDLKRGLLHVQATENWIPKDREARTIPLTRRFLEFLETYPMDGKYMIQPTVEKRAWRYRYDFRRSFKSFVASCGFPALTRHDMRRTFASLRVSAGVSIYKVARWLGDGVSVVERSYGHLIPQDIDIERDRVPDAADVIRVYRKTA